jgi:hypothetical protein
MGHPNEDLVREGFAAFGRGDMDALRRDYFAEDIQWHIPGRGQLAGDYEGVGQVLELFGRAFELTGGTLRLDLHDVLANDEHAVALYTANAERTGQRLQDRIAGVFHIRGGKITQVWLHGDDLYTSDEFWS